MPLPVASWVSAAQKKVLQENKKEVPQVGVKGTKCCKELYQLIRPNSLSQQPPVQDQTRKQVKLVKENNEESTLEREHFGLRTNWECFRSSHRTIIETL